MITPESPMLVEHLTKIYGDQRAVDDLSFDAHPGRLSRLVIESMPSVIATGWFGNSRRTRARRTLTRKLPR